MSEREDFADWKNQSNSVNPWMAWKARADLATEQIERLKAERLELVEALEWYQDYFEGLPVNDGYENGGVARKTLAKIDKENSDE